VDACFEVVNKWQLDLSSFYLGMLELAWKSNFNEWAKVRGGQEAL